VAAVWQDFRTEGNDIYLAFSEDGGQTFGRSSAWTMAEKGQVTNSAARSGGQAGRVVRIMGRYALGRRQFGMSPVPAGSSALKLYGCQPL
jgi:hypothetical protein